jgi:hypothetical protein
MSVEETLEQISKEVHKPINSKFRRRKVIVHNVMDILSADLVDMQEWADKNDGYKYLFTAIDCYSRFAWAFAMKDKTADTSLSALITTIKASKMEPKFLWVDEGKEFYNKKMDKYLKDHKIQRYSTHGDHKAAVIERFNRTLKTNMWKEFTKKNTRRWVDNLHNLLDTYNNKIHKSLNGKTPSEVFSAKEPEPEYHEWIKPQKDKGFDVGDRVRISRKKGVFEKGFHDNWSREIFTITHVLKTDPVTYKLKDGLGENIEGSFYSNEIQKTKQPADFGLVEEIVKSKGKGKNKQHLVKWMGLSSKYNSWISDEDIKAVFQ